MDERGKQLSTKELRAAWLTQHPLPSLQPCEALKCGADRLPISPEIQKSVQTQASDQPPITNSDWQLAALSLTTTRAANLFAPSSPELPFPK